MKDCRIAGYFVTKHMTVLPKELILHDFEDQQRPIMLLMGYQPTHRSPITSRLLLCWIPSEICGVN